MCSIYGVYDICLLCLIMCLLCCIFVNKNMFVLGLQVDMIFVVFIVFMFVYFTYNKQFRMYYKLLFNYNYSSIKSSEFGNF